MLGSSILARLFGFPHSYAVGMSINIQIPISDMREGFPLVLHVIVRIRVWLPFLSGYPLSIETISSCPQLMYSMPLFHSLVLYPCECPAQIWRPKTYVSQWNACPNTMLNLSPLQPSCCSSLLATLVDFGKENFEDFLLQTFALVDLVNLLLDITDRLLLIVLKYLFKFHVVV